MKIITTIILATFSLFPMASSAHDFSTQETVRFVMDCMAENGGLSDENFYYCTCRHDAIAENISFSDYEEGITFERNKDMPGDKGAVLRSMERGQEMYTKLQDTRKAADSKCILPKKVSR